MPDKKQKMNLAPIVLFTYNRLWHTQQTIEALQKNELAKDSDLIIYSDGANDKSSRAICSRIERVFLLFLHASKNYGL